MILQIDSPKYGIREVLIDDEDFDLVNKYNWHLSYYKKIKNFYALANVWHVGKGAGNPIRMHRLIMGNPKGFVIDHINHNTLDNRKENLRACTFQGNSQNMSKPSHGLSSIYKGVSKVKNSEKFESYIHLNNKKINLGQFTDELEAAKVYNDAALLYHGEFAKLNIIEVKVV